MTDFELLELAAKAAGTPEQIIELAREKQAEQEPVAWVCEGKLYEVQQYNRQTELPYPNQTPLYATPVSIEAAVLAEREACAKVCESKLPFQECYDFQKAAGNTARACAAAIRARGMK